MSRKCNRCSARPSVYVTTSFGDEHVCPACALSLIQDGQAQKVSEFVGRNWTIEAVWLPSETVAGYVTNKAGFTEPFNDHSYPNPWGSVGASGKVIRKLRKLTALLKSVPLRYHVGHRY
jgi:hypothetical protein